MTDAPLTAGAAAGGAMTARESPPQPGRYRNHVALGSAALLAAGILGLDLSLPFGVNVGVLYVAPLLIAAAGSPPTRTFLYAGAATALTLLGAVVAPAGGPPTIGWANRIVATAGIWTAAAVMWRTRITWVRLQTRTRDYVDVSYALNQSAIVATTDVTGKITFANDRFCEISKYSREELIGQDHRILNSAYHPKAFIQNLWRTIGSGRIWRGELRNRAKDGSIYWVDTTIVPFLNERGKPYQYMAIRYDITERKRSEEQLREQEALARLGQMAAVVAHEVKNPIAGIRGALQVIGSRLPTESGDRRVMADIIARLDGLNRIVQDLLVFARPRPMRAEPVDIRALLAATADHIRRDPALAATTVSIAGVPATISGDAEALLIVFQNILQNAAQAMAGGGQIDVTVAARGGTCDVTIADHGPGMPPDIREKAFEAFFTTKHRGTGLGLPTARRMIEAHGGTIELAETPGGGTSVLISMPTRSA
jgi:two-component system CheB/CheR fusion protein